MVETAVLQLFFDCACCKKLNMSSIMSLRRVILFLSTLTASLAVEGPFDNAEHELQRRQAGVPNYVLEYAPLVWLQSSEQYHPSDIGAQLVHTKPEVNFTIVKDLPNPLTLDNLNALNADGGKDVYLTSVDDITKAPAWLNGIVPDATGKTNGAVSSVIVVNDHGSGNVDAFYFYFYAYNQGDTVLGQELGDHVGDWEHNMIRFKNGIPQAVWFSQHDNGEAFTYNCLEKQGQRVVAYSAKGTHAVYATAGTHDHTIPDLNLDQGLIEDHCDQGVRWDPTLNAYWYRYDAASSSFSPYSSSEPVGYLLYAGQWGDQQYPDSDPRQREFFGFAKYTSGPTGPADKQLNRTQVCPDNGYLCIVRPVLGP
ncbi:hypothetical protein L228DRAFT_233066 [Xylona heveae TC161]|uniref:Vacuolar protein sorting-associated protein 62 n=1 Tax=Xylona heveae (strain CBS 132557 / TC161) TaxID=1328760 RepID=A0A165AGV8_XYLHT|nr:hypothetical protein L228DRAFT_233066 [Xylona heveae TC161]KZF20450.1 hypothetical protein L228DRAFT_233066 [Xylona heveae TC161]